MTLWRVIGWHFCTTAPGTGRVAAYVTRRRRRRSGRCLCILDTALLQWISEYAVRAYDTADSAVSYLNNARIA